MAYFSSSWAWSYCCYGYVLPKDKSGNQLWLGVGPNGIVQCPYENRMDPTMVSGATVMGIGMGGESHGFARFFLSTTNG